MSMSFENFKLVFSYNLNQINIILPKIKNKVGMVLDIDKIVRVFHLNRSFIVEHILEPFDKGFYTQEKVSIIDFHKKVILDLDKMNYIITSINSFLSLSLNEIKNITNKKDLEITESEFQDLITDAKKNLEEIDFMRKELKNRSDIFFSS